MKRSKREPGSAVGNGDWRSRPTSATHATPAGRGSFARWTSRAFPEPAKLAEVLQHERPVVVEVLLRAFPAGMAEAVRALLPPMKVRQRKDFEVKPEVLADAEPFEERIPALDLIALAAHPPLAASRALHTQKSRSGRVSPEVGMTC